MSFMAMYLPNSNRDKKDFSSREEVCEYVKNFLCDICLKDLERGFYTEDWGDGEIDKIEVLDALQTNCGAEWWIVPQEEYEKDIEPYLEEAGKHFTNDNPSPRKEELSEKEIQDLIEDDERMLSGV